MQEKAYWISEVSELTSININTIRKYCLLLEQNDYLFIRDDQDRRAFRTQDIIAIQEVTRLKKAEKITLEEAATRVAKMYSQTENDQPGIMPTITQNPFNADKNTLEMDIKAELDTITKRLNEVVQFNESLVQKLEQRDEEHFKRLDELMKTQLETRRLIAAAQDHPTKKWYQFWK